MTTYEDKKKLSEQFPPGTKVLVEIESIKDPKESPFKTVHITLNLFIFNYHIGNNQKNTNE